MRVFPFLFTFLLPAYLLAQADTAQLTVAQAEKEFTERNLVLLAERYGVDIAKAAVLQAKLWDNPSLYVEQNVYNRLNGKYFDFGPNGETVVEIEQLVYLAGKRNKRVKVEKANAEIAAGQFMEVLRGLRTELHTLMVRLYFLQKSVQVYDKEISELKKLTSAFSEQQQKGNMSLKEATRLRALLFLLESEHLELLTDVQETQSALCLLTGRAVTSQITPLFNDGWLALLSVNSLSFSLQDAIETALQLRYDLKMTESKVEGSKANVKLQKAMAVPDVQIKGSWDKAGNFINDYFAVGLTVDLPLLNRNQGNVKAAQFELKQNKLLQENQEKQVEREVVNVWTKVSDTEALFQRLHQGLSEDFSLLIDEVVKNYEKRNISMLEFIDFYESYKDARLQLYKLQEKRVLAYLELNFTIGKDIFKL